MSEASPERLPALDALRGIAAAVVLFSHYDFPREEMWPAVRHLLDHSPLFFFINAPAAVTLFFVLSGFVLARPFVGPDARRYRYLPFAVRRFFRVYVPFAVVIVLAGILYSVSPRTPVPSLSSGNNALWPAAPLTLTNWVEHLAMLGAHSQVFLDEPMWTLVHEWRISLAFPVLLWMARSTGLGIFLGVSMLLLTPVVAVTWGHFSHFPYAADDVRSTLIVTASCVPTFLCGVLIAKHRHALMPWCAALPVFARGLLWVLVLGALAIDTYSLPHNALLVLSYTPLTGLLLVLAVATPTAARWLGVPVLQGLGHVSYSLYLIHIPIRLAILHTLDGRMEEWAMALLGAGLSVLAAACLYRFVERPAMALGKRLGQRFEQS